ncbi:MAG: TM2 domain-containing membrane protein YozV [Vicingaceae bacterium]|jgi:TM2 domain-containing membrane protein YozV
MLNKLQHLLLILIFGISTVSVASTEAVDISILQQTEFLDQIDLTFENDQTSVVKPKFRKLKAVLLAVFLGHFGVHRIYLGTKENVPIVYSLTLGGGFGLLPFFDIIAILSSKDLDEYTNNNKVFMWSNKKRN